MSTTYNRLEDIPEVDRGVVERLLEKGAISTSAIGEFNISEDSLKVLQIIARLGYI